MKQLYIAFLLACLFSVNAFPQSPLSCGVDDRNLPDSTVRLMGQLPRLMADQRARKAAGERRTCRLAVEIDSDTYLEFEKDTNRIRSYVVNQIEAVSKIYEREINTQLVVVYVHIWKDTEPDPYRGELNIYTLHSRFATVWNSQSQLTKIPSDKRIYLPTKPVYGAGGLGDLGGKYATAVINTFVIAHELGHNFGSPHTHSCSWPGGPIDYCSSVEGSCYTESLQNIRGTIMSYCNGTSLTFHPLCQTLTMDHATKNFTPLTTPDKAPVLPAQITLSGTPFLYWDGQPQADFYAIQVAEDAGFAKTVVNDTTSINGYNLAGLTPGQPYYVRTRTVNRFGVSNWSGNCQLQIALAGSQITPVLLSPKPDQTMVPYTNTSRQFSVQPVNGATGYEIQLTSSYDESFKTPATTKISPTSSFTVATSSFGMVRWRVRAVFADKSGPWSVVGRFFVNQSPGYFYRSYYDTAPLTVPYAYYSAVNGATVQVTVATDSLFTQPFYTHTFRDDSFYTGMLDGLAPNTQYYIKFDETSQDYGYPTGVLSRLVQSFKTNSTVLSSKWSFINNATRPDWPQGYLSGPLELTKEAAWYANTNGPTRISQDSLALRVFSRETTKGKIGNLSSAVSADGNGAMWVTNRTSVNIFKNGFAVPYYQLGKISEQTGTLTQRTDYYTNDGFTTFNASQRLFFRYNAIYQPRADSLDKVYTLPDNHSIFQTLTRPGFVWMIQYNSASTTANYELVQLNTITRAVKIFTSDNTPQLGKYLSALATDGLGNLWVSQSSSAFPFPPFAKFDGQNWTSVDKSSTMPISYALNFSNDPLGNLYVIDNTLPRVLYKYDGTTWKKLAEMPISNAGTMTADYQGNIWFTGPYQLLRYAACANAPTPVLTSTKKTIHVGENTTLQAAGCSDVLWSWSSTTETVDNRLVKGTNQLVVTPTANTTYRSRCYTSGCSGDETTTAVAVVPKLVASITGNAAICQAGTATLKANSSGGLGPFSYQWTLSNTPVGTNSATFSTTSAGTYTLMITDTLGGVSTASFAVTVSNPKPSPMGLNLFCEGTSTVFSASATGGTGTYTYNWKREGTSIGQGSSLTLTQGGNYVLEATDQMGCVGQSNSFTVSTKPSPTASAGPGATLTGTELYKTESFTTAKGGTPPYAYQWRTNPAIVAGNNETTANPVFGPFSTTTTLTLVVSDNTGCSNTTTATIAYVPCSLSAGLSGSPVLCGGNPAKLTAVATNGNDGLVYEWKKGGAVIGSAIDQTISTADTYALQITDAKGCTASRSFSVGTGTIPDATISNLPGALALLPNSTVSLSANTGTGLTYQWSLNGNAITGATSSVYPAQSPGVYTVSVSNGGCSTTSAGVTITLITAIEPVASGLNMSVLPNPILGQTTVVLTLDSPSSAVIHLVDANGRSLRSWSMPTRQRKHELTVDCTSLPTGTYLFKAISEEKQVVRKVVKE